MSSDKADGPHLKCDQYPLNTPPPYRNKKGTHSVSKAFCTRANEKHKRYSKFPVCFLFFFLRTPPSIFEPRVCCDGGFTAVPIVIQQLLTLVNVSRRDENEVRNAVDVVEFGLAVSVFTVIDQPTHSTRLFRGIHTVENTHTQSTAVTSDVARPSWHQIIILKHSSAPVSDAALQRRYVGSR